ncbi:helix-turn-helix domain-containing protein [Paenibacillus marchantiae]
MYDLINNGGVPHVKIGKQNRIPRAELELWIEQQIITS